MAEAFPEAGPDAEFFQNDGGFLLRSFFKKSSSSTSNTQFPRTILRKMQSKPSKRPKHITEHITKVVIDQEITPKRKYNTTKMTKTTRTTNTPAKTQPAVQEQAAEKLLLYTYPKQSYSKPAHIHRFRKTKSHPKRSKTVSRRKRKKCGCWSRNSKICPCTSGTSGSSSGSGTTTAIPATTLSGTTVASSTAPSTT